MKLRIALVAAMAGTALFVGAAPASATCDPDKPSTCEAEYPWDDANCSADLSLPDGSNYVIDYCELLP